MGLTSQSTGNGLLNNDFEILKNSVNPIRLKNNPVKLIMEDIDCLYHQILEK